MVNTRQKGKELERHVAEQIRAKGIDSRAYARGDSGGGNQEKTDITTSMQVLGKNAGIECKFASQAKPKVWWEQVSKLETLGYEPLLVYKLNHESFGDSKVTMYLDTFLDMVVAANQSAGIAPVEDNSEHARNLRYASEKLVYAAKDLLKLLQQ